MKLRIKKLIKDQGITMYEFAEKLGIARVNLTKTINGNPTVETLERIATLLQVPITELFEVTPGMTKIPGATKCPYCSHDLTLRVE
jgi:transcriptional regulator with XRE-family HTH domain